MAFGCFGVALSYLILVAAAFSAGGGKASWLWLAAYFVVITIGELYLSPIGLSLVTKVAPARAVSMMMGLWLATSFTGNFLAGYLGSFWSGMDKGSFFLMIAVIAALAGLVILAFVRPLKPILRASRTSRPFEPIAKCDRFKLDPNGIHHRHHGPRLEHERRQHRAELVDRQRIVAVQHHVAAPIADADHEQLDLEIVRRLPLGEDLEDALLGTLVLHRRALRALGPAEHVFHGYPP